MDTITIAYPPKGLEKLSRPACDKVCQLYIQGRICVRSVSLAVGFPCGPQIIIYMVCV